MGSASHAGGAMWPLNKGTALSMIASMAFGMAMTVLMVVAWWAHPISVLSVTKPIVVANESYSPGDLLEYDLSYCKSADIEAEVSYAFIDSVSYATPGKTSHELPLGCHTVKEAIEVPTIPDGVYRLEMTRIYQPSPLQRIEVRSKSDYFNVVK